MRPSAPRSLCAYLALRLWMDGRGVGQNDLQTPCAHLASAYPFAARLNSMARQAAADRAWQAVARFYKNCLEKKPGTPAKRRGQAKGYPRLETRPSQRRVQNQRVALGAGRQTHHFHRWPGHRAVEADR